MKQGIQLKKKEKAVKDTFFGKPGPTPAGRALADSVRKAQGPIGKAVTAARVFARDTKNEVVNSFKGKSQQATGDPDPGAAKRKIQLKTITDSTDKKLRPAMKDATTRIDAKLKRHSREITRGTPAANKPGRQR